MKLTWLMILLAMVVGTAVDNPASAATHNVQSLGTLGGSTSSARAVSSNGFVAGHSTTATGATHAFLWQNGVMQDLGTLGGSMSMAYGVNSKGEVVGFSMTSTGTPHGFLWHDGKMEDLGTLAGYETGAYSINDNSQIAGYSLASPFGPVHTVLWQSGSLQDLGAVGGNGSSANSINSTGDVAGQYYSTVSRAYKAFAIQNGVTTYLDGLSSSNGEYFAYDINDAGQIVGIAPDQFGRTRPVLWENGRIQDLGTPDVYGYANAVNNNRQIVGYTYTDYTQPKAFLWVNGMTQNLDAMPGYTYSQAYDINNNGWIVGASGNQAVLWTPVPEAASLSVLFTGLLCVLPRLQRRRR